MTDLHDAQPEPERGEELFTEFVNDFELPIEDSGAASALGAWMADRDLVRRALPARRIARELAAFGELRDLVRGVVSRVADGREPTETQVRSLNRVLRDGVHHHVLRPDPAGATFTVNQVGDELDQARAAVAGSLAHYLADHDRRRLRVCANDTCRWLFVDRSPAGRRRWCDMRTCGNRAKVARHRARARDARRWQERRASRRNL